MERDASDLTRCLTTALPRQCGQASGPMSHDPCAENGGSGELRSRTSPVLMSPTAPTVAVEKSSASKLSMGPALDDPKHAHSVVRADAPQLGSGMSVTQSSHGQRNHAEA